MKRIILFIIISMNLSAFEIKDNIGIFDENSKREFEEKVRKIENKSNFQPARPTPLSFKISGLHLEIFFISISHTSHKLM